MTQPTDGDQPRIENRAAQPYAGIRMAVTMAGFPAAADSAFPALFAWLGSHGVAPAGAPFIRYHVIDMAGELQIEFGAPVAAPVEGDGQVQPGTAPAGRYLVLRHTGPYDQLIGANAALQDYAKQHGIAFAARDTPAGEAWDGRFEHYLTDPTAEPDAARWQTDVAYLLADAD
jgi:effector-binding domain-containing protein